MDNSSKKHLLSEMYPYSIAGKKNADLRKGLEEYKCIISALEDAILNFQNGNLEKFDALVGENACQIRAIKIAILASKNGLDLTALNALVTSAKKSVIDLLEPKKIARLMVSHIDLKRVFLENGLEISLTNEQMFLFQAFLLCEAKEGALDEESIKSLTAKSKVSHKKLKKYSSEISINFAHSLINKIRKSLAKKSVNYIRKIASELNDANLVKMTSSELTIEHNALQSQPMFWTYKALLQTAHNKDIPLILHAKFVKENSNGYQLVNEEILYFTPTKVPGCTGYAPTCHHLIDPCSAACVIQGFVCLGAKNLNMDKSIWKSKITENQIVNVILAGAADHRQHPGETLNFNDPELDQYKIFAENNGYANSNPSTFFINHVFPIQINRAPSLAKTA